MTKKRLILLLFVLIISLNLKAQNKFEIGINSGLNYPTLWGYDFASNQNFRIGYLLGLSFEYSLNKKTALKSNVNYVREIKKRENTFFNSDAEEIGGIKFKEITNLINIPILLKYDITDSGLFINSGPFFNYLLSTKFNQENPFEERDRENSTPLKKINYGFSLGIGQTFSIDDRNKFTIEIRDDLGLADIGGVPNQLDGAARTNSIKFILNWSLGG